MGKGILEVQLIEAKGLLDTDVIGDIDPYVVIQYRSQEQKSSVARAQGTHPVWNETFKFVVHNPASAASSQQHKLILRIMDHDTFTADDFIGEASINVADLISLGIENGICELRPTKYSVVLSDRTYRGEIRAAVKFTAKVEVQENEEEVGGWKHSFHH